MRPRDFTPTPHRRLKQVRFLTELLAGATPDEAAARVRQSLRTLYTWRRRNPAFRRAWDRARQYAKHPPFPALPELESYAGTRALMIPGESQSLVLPQPGKQMWIEQVTRCRDDGTIETTRHEVEPTPEERAAFEAKYRAWDAERRR